MEESIPSHKDQHIHSEKNVGFQDVKLKGENKHKTALVEG